MRNYIINKLLIGILMVFTVTVLVFSMLYLMPGDPISHMVDPNVPQERIEELRIIYGFDKPLHIQYMTWLKKIVFERDLGTSYKNKLKVWDLIKVRIPISLKLTVPILLIQLSIAIPLGLLCAYKKGSLFDRSAVGISLFFTAIPSMWLSILLMLFFAIKIPIFPLSGIGTPKHFVLPIIVGVLGGVASTLRLTKTEAIDVFQERYVLTAYAKGLKKKDVLIKHVLRNALMLVVVLAFMSIPFLISGVVVIESVFALPGMGSLMVDSIVKQDFPIVQACLLIISSITVISNILSDIFLGLLDPRIRLSLSGGGN